MLQELLENGTLEILKQIILLSIEGVFKFLFHFLTGMQHEVIFGDQPWGLNLEEKILPQFLKENNYVTRAVGKWHLGHFKALYLPEARGSVMFSILII